MEMFSRSRWMLVLAACILMFLLPHSVLEKVFSYLMNWSRLTTLDSASPGPCSVSVEI